MSDLYEMKVKVGMLELKVKALSNHLVDLLEEARSLKHKLEHYEEEDERTISRSGDELPRLPNIRWEEDSRVVREPAE